MTIIIGAYKMVVKHIDSAFRLSGIKPWPLPFLSYSPKQIPTSGPLFLLATLLGICHFTISLRHAVQSHILCGIPQPPSMI